MKIYFVRHGETPWNKAKRFQGQIDIPLNDFGRAIAEITRREMPQVHFDKVFSSPLCRAYETAQILLADAPAVPIEKDARLKEIGFGSFEGCAIASVASDPSHPLYDCLWHPERYVPPVGAESFDALIARAGSFLTDQILPLEATCSHVLVTAHGAFNRAVVASIGSKTVADFWSVNYLNCAVTVLELHKGRFSLLQEAKLYYDPEVESRKFNAPDDTALAV